MMIMELVQAIALLMPNKSMNVPKEINTEQRLDSQLQILAVNSAISDQEICPLICNQKPVSEAIE